MKSLEYITKVFKASYTDLAKRLKLATSTVTDWSSGRRPIPKDKLELLSKLFKIDEEYFVDKNMYVKELNEVEKIKIEINYLERAGKRDSFEVPTTFEDNDGNIIEGYYWVNPYEGDLRYLYEELAVEELTKKLKGILSHESYSKMNGFDGNNHFQIVQKLVVLLDKDEMIEVHSNEEQSEETVLTSKKVDALDTMLFYLTGGKMWGFKDENDFSKDLHDLLLKYDLVTDKQFEETENPFEDM